MAGAQQMFTIAGSTALFIDSENTLKVREN